MRKWERAIRQWRVFKRDERGAQLVELAIVIPIFLILFATVAEFGRFFYEYTTLAKAARVGTRHLTNKCINGTEDTAAKNLVVFGNTAGSGTPVLKGLTTSNVQIVRKNAAGATVTAGVPQTATVQIVNYQYQPIFDLGKLLKSSTLSMNVQVSPSVTMRYLLSQPCS
jgi:Flp pilus assembly protein TadG